MAGTALQRRLIWRTADVLELVDETPRVRTLVLAVPGWPGHQAGQHVDVRLTADDGYRTERSYSIASPPTAAGRLSLTVERLEDGEVSPYLAGELRPGDRLELRGPIGGYFVWDTAMGGPLLLVAGGSGICPLMAMLRLRHAAGSAVPTRLLYSSRSLEDVIYRDELDRLVVDESRVGGDPHLDPHPARGLGRAPSPHRRCDAHRGGLAAGRAAADLRLRADAARRVGRGVARAPRSRAECESRPSASAQQEADMAMHERQLQSSTATPRQGCSRRSSFTS